MTAQLFAFPDINPSLVDPPKPKAKAKEKYSPEFEQFWAPYPRKLNCSKLMAYKAWCKLDEDDQSLAMKVLPFFIRMCRGKDEQYIPHAVTWLNQRRFETVQLPIQPQTTINIDWPTVLKIYGKTNNWNYAYGPAPDEPGYLGPK
ncbi:MAG TPA: hypothetical protein VMW38_25105 [Terriglobia bacterium]|nr:hypothetical protein [Terriglobia bacterium]